MASSGPMHRRVALIWNIATCAVIIGVAVFLVLRTASPMAFVVAAILLIVLAILLRRYRQATRGPRTTVVRRRDTR